MKPAIPKYVSRQYVGGASGFRIAKRRQLAEIRRALRELQRGAAFFPGGADLFVLIKDSADQLAKDISAKNWGR